MELYLNENSLSEQFPDNRSFLESIKRLIAIFEYISTLPFEKRFWKSKYFYSNMGVPAIHFGTCLKSNPQINRAFVENLDKLNPKNWETSQVHNPHHSFTAIDINFCTKSIAEATERQLRNPLSKNLLINFEPSIFSDFLKISVVKNNAETVELSNSNSVDSIYQWLVLNDFIQPNAQYDQNSKVPPLDEQTVLRDTELFHVTNIYNKGRKVYKREGFNEYWVVDSSPRHANDKAHLEIFDSITGVHIGTSLYNIIEVDHQQAKPGRRLAV